MQLFYFLTLVITDNQSQVIRITGKLVTGKMSFKDSNMQDQLWDQQPSSCAEEVSKRPIVLWVPRTLYPHSSIFLLNYILEAPIDSLHQLPGMWDIN